MQELILSQTVFFAVLALFGLGAISSLFFRKDDKLANLAGSFFAILGSLLGIVYAVAALYSDTSIFYEMKSSFPLLSYNFNIDRLAAFFIFIISLISLFCSIYGAGYIKHFYGKYNIGTLGFFYNLFIAGMLLVVSSSNILFFLIAWEIMSLASYFLVIYERDKQENIKAGFLYFVMTHIGTAFIILALLLLYKFAGSFDFLAIKEAVGSIPPLAKDAIFILAFIGFGTKAGIIPMHIWLPAAHPAAPSHVSALMSGVMIKTGIYMMIRIFFDILPNAPVWWGTVILICGATSALLGVLYALTEHDIKRLLAYHSIENIGIILLGLGSALVFAALNMKSFAALALIASLFHILNHAVFKSLLFLGAGSVISKTHTRNIEEYGGLIKHMPQTALFFLAGSMAISALPPFNGFFSEWLTFQALFEGIKSMSSFYRWIFVFSAGSLVLTSGLALACFVKAFGLTFLARPRSEAVKHAKESSFSLRLGMATLAVLCLLLGLLSGFLFAIFNKILQGIKSFGDYDPALVVSQNHLISVNGGFSSISAPAIFAVLILAGIAAFAIIRLISKDQKVKIGATWDCGTNLGPRMEITSTGFSRTIIMIFKGILKPSKQAGIEYSDANMRYFPKSRTMVFEISDVYKKYFYKPLYSFVFKISARVKKIQSGNVNAYVLYIFMALILLLFFAV
ncbi:hydrogenase 4 subunit B [Patescibacteria group bacterium]|nr:MAG: hydrogenase 4 subunit B [Patescibacteria group bacterium]